MDGLITSRLHSSFIRASEGINVTRTYVTYVKILKSVLPSPVPITLQLHSTQPKKDDGQEKCWCQEVRRKYQIWAELTRELTAAKKPILVGGSLRLRRRGPSQHDQVPIASKVGLPTDKEGEEHVAVIPMMLEHKEMDLEADMWWRQNAQLQMHQEHNLMPMSQRRHKYLCQHHG